MNLFPLIPPIDVTVLAMPAYTKALLAVGLISRPSLLWEFTKRNPIIVT